MLEELHKIVGDKGLLTGDALRDHPACLFKVPRALVRPISTEELSQVMALCHSLGQVVVSHGGRTGLVRGNDFTEEDVIVSLERMNKIEELDMPSRTMTVQAGVVLQTVQEAAEEQQLMFPLDFGARGSATIGGAISTNAGGNRVLRYGMTRELVLGLEAVLADGTVISSMNHVLKNNTGYDLKQLFIGSEGTLGIVTRAVLRLRPLALSQNTAMVAVTDFEKLSQLLNKADCAFGGSLSSFEVMWANYYDYIAGQGHQKPIADDYPYYVILETLGADQEADDVRFNTALETLFEQELIADAVIAQSSREREGIWEIRDDVEAMMSLYPFFIYDVSVPLSHMENYVADVQAKLQAKWPEQRNLIFGHLGDGNIHVIAAVGSDSPEARSAVEEIIYGCLIGRDGVISAEHGIGLEKKSHLHISRSDSEIALMQSLKTALDGKCILNPGKIIDAA
jgi:FAD/FMN-containing dehydrogenase